MAKVKLLIALLVIFILPVFIGSYDKYSNQSYIEMNYTEIGREYTDYFSEGMEEISIIGDIGKVSITVMDYITDAIDWIMDAFQDIIGFFKSLLKIDKDEGSVGPPTAGGDGWENPGNGLGGLI